MEKVGYTILIIVAITWMIAMIIGMFENLWIGIIGLITIIGLGFLFIKALADRLASKKDDKYSKEIKK